MAGAGEAQAPAAHRDFLFGVERPPLLSLQGSIAGQHELLISPTRLAPKLSMLAGVSGVLGGVAQSVGRKSSLLDPFGEDDDAEERGSDRYTWVPRGLRFFGLNDLLSGLVLASSWGSACDVPLRAWLVGGMLLGFPVSRLIHAAAQQQRPTYSMYRLSVSGLRGDGAPEGFRIEGVQLCDQFGQAIEGVQSDRDACHHRLVLSNGAAHISEYKVITHRTADPVFDPVCWTLEGSNDGIDWKVLDEINGAEVPLQRGAPTAVFDDLLYQGSPTQSFRVAFLTEVLATAASFAWLVAGTAWVGMGSETCVDSAPLLWWPSFVIVAANWSLLGTVSVGIILSAVAMVVLGAKSAPP